MSNSLGYKKFLKEQRRLQVGDYLPNCIIGNNGLYDLIKNDHMILVLISTGCESCFDALSAIVELNNESKETNIVLLVDTEEATFHQMREMLRETIKLLKCDKAFITKELFTWGLPWGYGINREGQIITSNAVGSITWLKQIVYPFRKRLTSISFDLDTIYM